MIKCCFEQMDIHRSTDRKNTIGYSLLIYQYKFQSYVEDDNSILVENDIMKAISFNGGISVTTYILIYETNVFGKRASKKINPKIKTGARETHEVCWQKYLVEVTKPSNVSVT